jgi:hypothetical protein
MQIPISAIVKGRRYHIQYAERADNVVVFTKARDDTETLHVKHLPLCSSSVITDLNIEQINSDRMCMYITYKGYCRHREIPLLEISYQWCQ